MLKLSKVKIISLGLITILIVFIWPLYEFYAYKGQVGFPAFYQFIGIPKSSPTTQVLHHNKYKKAGIKALDILTQHKIIINAPAISAAVAMDGELVWAGVSGWSELENQTPITTNSQFRIGSTSKALTGTALARMVDKNLIDIDNPISEYISDLPNKSWQNITSRLLASHMSGLPHYKENTDYVGLYKTLSLSTRYKRVKNALSVFDGSELLFEPGTQFSYSSFGTVLLSAVMSASVNQPYLDIMRKQVFLPLNMSSTMAEFEVENRDNLVSFYWNNKGKSNKVRKWREVDLSHRLAGGGFVSTSSDLVKMGVAFLRNDFITEKTRTKFWTPQILPDGSETPNGYGLGWRVKMMDIGDERVMVAHHGGVSRGAQSWLMVIPKYNMSIAVNINANTDAFWDFGKVSKELAKIFIREKSLP